MTKLSDRGLRDGQGPSAESHSREESAAAARFASAWEDFLLALRRSQARGQGSRGELTLAQYYVLAQFSSGAAIPITQLAEAAGVAVPTATRLVDGLERAGLLRRERSNADRRAVLVSITDLGRRRLRSKQRQVTRRRRLIYERLEPEERAQSERLLRHLAEVIAEL
jgi:MarR family transcriptional regulator, organic hydroperoxide resistance regulator